MNKTIIASIIAGIITAIVVLVVFSLESDIASSSGPGLSPPNLLTSETPAHIMSCADLQRELNRMDPTLKLEVDGICGPATQAAWDEVVNTQYALKLWPIEK